MILRRSRTIDDAAVLLRHMTRASINDFACELASALAVDDDEPCATDSAVGRSWFGQCSTRRRAQPPLEYNIQHSGLWASRWCSRFRDDRRPRGTTSRFQQQDHRPFEYNIPQLERRASRRCSGCLWSWVRGKLMLPFLPVLMTLAMALFASLMMRFLQTLHGRAPQHDPCVDRLRAHAHNDLPDFVQHLGVVGPLGTVVLPEQMGVSVPTTERATIRVQHPTMCTASMARMLTLSRRPRKYNMQIPTTRGITEYNIQISKTVSPTTRVQHPTT